jgi:hypothetical protein
MTEVVTAGQIFLNLSLPFDSNYVEFLLNLAFAIIESTYSIGNLAI